MRLSAIEIGSKPPFTRMGGFFQSEENMGISMQISYSNARFPVIIGFSLDVGFPIPP